MDIYVLIAHRSPLTCQFPLFATKVDGPYSVIVLIKSTIIEWYVVRCGFKHGYQKAMCLKGIRLRAQNMITILKSIVDNTVGTYTTT